MPLVAFILSLKINIVNSFLYILSAILLQRDFLRLTFVDKSFKIVLSDKGRADLTRQKMGRPTDDPKPFKLDVRVSKQDLDILDDYCKRKEKTRPESVREAIRSLKDK